MPAQFDHTHRAVGVARVDGDRRGGLMLRVFGEPPRDGITGFAVVVFARVVVFRQQIVIEINLVVVVRAQHLDRFGGGLCDIDFIACEVAAK